MKKILLTLFSVLMVTGTMAQTHLRVWQKGKDNRMKIASVGDMTFSGSQLTLKDKTYELKSIDSIVVVPEVTVLYSGTTATVNIPAAVSQSVTAKVSGGHVELTNTDEKNEIEVVLAGQCSDGSFTYKGQYKTTFILNGLNLTSSKGAAINIDCGKRCALELADGTVNTLVDATNGNQKACLYCKGHLEVEGSGTLNVSGQSKHAISTKEYLQLKKSTGTINIVKAASDGIHCGQYFQMNGGVVTIDENTIGDGIQVEALLLDDGTPDPNEEKNGQLIIKGGKTKQTISHEDCKGLKCDGTITISGGDIDITASGNGSRGVQADGLMTINENDATTTINILATGGRCTLKECADDPHRCVGMKLDGGLVLQAGQVTVKATGSKSRSIQVPVGGYTKTGGTLTCDPKITEK